MSILFLSFIPVQTVSQNGSLNKDAAKNEVIGEALKLVYTADYEGAIKHFRKLDQIDPGSAEGMFFEAFVLELIMDVYRSQVFDDSLKKVVNAAIKIAEQKVDKEKTARNYMYLGGTYGVRGVRKGILGSWYRSAMDGRKAYKNMEKAIKLDPDNSDCYYGIGLYHYWRTKKLRKWFPFLSDQREKGISELKLAIEQGIFAETPGRNALFRIYIEEGMYGDVCELAAKVLAENPQHLFPRWYCGIAEVRLQMWKSAIEKYQIILEMISKVGFHGIEADIECWYYLSICHFQLGENKKARDYLLKIIPYKGKVNTNLFYYEDYVKESEKLLKKVNKKIGSGL